MSIASKKHRNYRVIFFSVLLLTLIYTVFYCPIKIYNYTFKSILLLIAALFGSFIFNWLKIKKNMRSLLFFSDFNILGAEVGIIIMTFIYSGSYGLIEKTINKEQNNFREALNMLRKSQIQALKDGAYNEISIGKYYFEELMNNPHVKKLCPTNSELQGCWHSTKQHSVEWETQEGGVELNSGVDITGFGIKIEPKTGYDGIYIDWNGSDGPNIYGEDQLWVIVCFSKLCGAHGNKESYSITPYDFKPYGPSRSEEDVQRNEKLFNSIQWSDPLTEDDRQYLGILGKEKK